MLQLMKVVAKPENTGSRAHEGKPMKEFKYSTKQSLSWNTTEALNKSSKESILAIWTKWNASNSNKTDIDRACEIL